MSSIVDATGRPVISVLKKTKENEEILSHSHHLDSRSRAVVYLYLLCGFSQRQIAGAFGLSQPAVLKILRKAYRTIARAVINAGNTETTHDESEERFFSEGK